MNTPNAILIDMGKRIIERRRSLGLSQEELAELTDLTPQTISTAERGVKGVRPENLLSISKALSVSTDYLLTGEIIDKDISFLNKYFESKTPEQVKAIIKIIETCSELCENKAE